ncbi:MAG: ABC transporter ATP-binding protein [Verrucomicrobiales bacterium]|nr:ABC transporter ATP-binding protein [Verrucomicrobiales bacterium]
MISREQPILKVRDLKRSYGNFVAVDGLNLQVNEGEIYGFLGVNGAGKTTTIRMLMGIIAPESGTIELMGETSRRTTLKQKQKIGYVSQEQVFYPWMTARMLGKFVGGLYPEWDKQEFERLLNILEVPPNRKSSQLSGGMRVKLALALALAPRPSLLILDEPTAGMDPVARREFLDIIEHQAREYGRTTFFSTHLLNEVERAADRVGIIHRGKQRFEGDLSLLQSRVKKIKVAEGTVMPAGFDVWKVMDRSPDDVSGMQEMVVDAPPELWTSSGLTGERLSLDDIFISCVGVATMKI